MLVYLATTIFVLGVVTTTRLQSAPQLLDLDLPPAYLPGGQIPENVMLYLDIPYETTVRRSVIFRDKEIVLSFDARLKTILRAAIQTQELTIGEAIINWGTPTGIVQTYYLTSVHWGTRSAYMYSDSFQPNSRVDFIQYDLEPQRTSSWRGFRPYRN
jgi:hypothetical protein